MKQQKNTFLIKGIPVLHLNNVFPMLEVVDYFAIKVNDGFLALWKSTT
jgi:hypothetical protein